MSTLTEETLAVLEAESEAYRNNERGYLEFWAITAAHFDPLIAEVRRLREAGPHGWLVFPNRWGQPLDAHNIAARHLKPACDSAGIPRIGWHALRHTAISLMDAAGMSGAEKRLVAGHGSDRMTERYSHGFMDRARQLMPKGMTEVIQ